MTRNYSFIAQYTMKLCLVITLLSLFIFMVEFENLPRQLADESEVGNL